jgi:hypothetical protein
MGLCSDNSNQYLRDVGYNVVNLPRDFLPPLSLLARQGDSIEYIGGIDKLITKPAGSLPTATTDQTAANINGKSTSSLKLSLGLSILNGLIAGLGGSKLGASAGYTNARTITFEFNNVTFDSVAALDVGNYLRDGDVDESNPLLAQYVLGNGKLYVVTERLRASEITTSFEVSGGVNAQLDVPAIANQVGGNLKVEIANGRTNAVKFKGDHALTFAFKCFQIGVKDGVITMFSVKPGSVVASLDEEPNGSVTLGEGMIDISEAGA